LTTLSNIFGGISGGIFGGIYGGAVAARNSLYDRGWLPARQLQGAVISVGSISVGGAGKTPFVMLLGELLQTRGIEFDILSRGYGRRSRGAWVVDPGGLAREFGDEPLLMARRLEVPVIVGEDRYEAGRIAESKFGPRLHLLDDGFQHRALARDFDIALVTPQDANDRLLPGGRLREPLSALNRADAVVLASGASAEAFGLEGDGGGEKSPLPAKPGRSGAAEQSTHLPRTGESWAPQQRLIWCVRRGIDPKNIPGRPVVFCGVARPQGFVLQLRAANVEPAAEAFYRDHHAYSEKDVRDLLALKAKSEAGGFVTTEKDAVNLGAYLSALEPLAVVPVRMELTDAANALDTMLGVIEERRRGA
jgi:tetraacyldisaccharide 4'-kinase